MYYVSAFQDHGSLPQPSSFGIGQSRGMKNVLGSEQAHVLRPLAAPFAEGAWDKLTKKDGTFEMTLLTQKKKRTSNMITLLRRQKAIQSDDKILGYEDHSFSL